jgi:chromosome partitioning protein
VTVLTIAGAKGGVGKTTTAVSLAAILAARQAVTLEDLDPQASATLALGQTPPADPWTAEPLELAGLPALFTLRPGGRALAMGTADRVRTHLARSLDRGPAGRLGSGRTVVGVAGNTVGNTVTGAGLLRNVEPGGLTVRDCPPGLSPLTVAAIEGADLVLVPLEASPLALPGLADVAAIVASLPSPPRLRAVLVRVNPRRILTGDVRDRIRADYPGALYAEEIPEDVRAAEAPGFGLPVTVYAPSSRSALAYGQLARAVVRDLARTTHSERRPA